MPLRLPWGGRAAAPQDRPDVELLRRGVLARIYLTDHAIERFSERAGLDVYRRADIEPIIHDLLGQEGLLAHVQPHWARSANEADLYIQAGTWMLFICRTSRRHRGSYAVVTVVAGPSDNTWARAYRRGHILTPPPLQVTPPRRERARLGDSLRRALAARDRDLERRRGLLRTVIAVHRAESSRLATEYASADSAFHQALADHEDERQLAREEHRRRYGR